jgi:hypothetical protein
MKNYTFNWEIQTLVEQFIGAFNDVIIKRYDKDNVQVEPLSGDKVLFVYSPKQRVFSNLNSPAAGGLTVPVIAVNISGISRDQSRVFNKIDGFLTNYEPEDDSGNLLKRIPQPVPINIGITMTIITKYQADMDQILTNFIPYCDPYIVISWKLPETEKTKNPYEIRTEVLWDGNMQMQYPDNLGPTQLYRITGTTNFTIKGWLFKKMDEVYKKIYTIESKYLTSDGQTTEDGNILQTPTVLKSYSNFAQTYLGVNSQLTQSPDNLLTTEILNSLTREVSSLNNNIESINSYLYSNSSAFLSGYDLGFLSVSGNWNDAYTNLVYNSALYLYTPPTSSLTTGDYEFVLGTDGTVNVPISVDGNALVQTTANALELNVSGTITTFDNTGDIKQNGLSVLYNNIYASATYETIQQFAQSSPQNVKKGYTVTLLNNRIYIFAGTDPTNPNHYLEINANPITPIYQEISLNQNHTLIDSFSLVDFKTAKYALQIETSFSNDIYYSEFNVLASILSNNAVVSEYGQISTTDLILGYNAYIDIDVVNIFLFHNIDPDNSHKLIVKGSRSNYYKI